MMIQGALALCAGHKGSSHRQVTTVSPSRPLPCPRWSFCPLEVSGLVEMRGEFRAAGAEGGQRDSSKPEYNKHLVRELLTGFPNRC